MIRWLVVGAVIALAYVARDVFPPFVIGAVIAYLLHPAVGALCKRTRLPRIAAVLAIYLLAVAGLSIALYEVMPLAVSQATSLFSQRQEIIQNLLTQFVQATHWHLDVPQVTADILGKIETSIVSKPEELLAAGGAVTKSLLSVLMVLFVSFSLLIDGERFVEFGLRFVPKEKREGANKILADVDDRLTRYVNGQLLLMLIVSIFTYAVMGFYGVKYGLLIALMAGLLEVIPMVGPLLAIVVAAGVAVSQLGLAPAIGVPICLIAFRPVQDYIIVPRVIGNAVELHPVAMILAVLMGEAVAGGLGMLLAVPFAAAVKVVLDLHYPDEHAAAHAGSKGRTIQQRLLELLKQWRDRAVAWYRSLRK